MTNLFVASSIVEMHDERIAVSNVEQCLNNYTVPECSHFYHFIKCEHLPNNVQLHGSQEAYNDKIRAADGLILLAGNRGDGPDAAKYTKQELEVAVEQKKKDSNYKISIFIDSRKNYEELIRFLEPSYLEFQGDVGIYYFSDMTQLAKLLLQEAGVREDIQDKVMTRFGRLY